MNSNNKNILFIFLFLFAVAFYFISDLKNQKNASHPNHRVSAEYKFPKNGDYKKMAAKPIEKISPGTSTMNAPSIDPSQLDNDNVLPTLDLTGIDKDFRECFQDSASWTFELKDNIKGFAGLKNELEKVLETKYSDIETYREKTIQLPNGETRVIHLEIGTSDSKTGNKLYWSKPDYNGLFQPDDLPKEINPENMEDFDKLLKYGETKISRSTRNLIFKNGVELSVFEVNGEVSAISVQTENHQTTCQVDPVKRYKCNCVY